MKLLHVSQRFRRLLAVTKLNGVLTSFESEEDAIASFTSSSDAAGEKRRGRSPQRPR